MPPDQAARPDDRRQIGYLITDVARLMRAAFDRRARQIGLTRPQWQVLSRLHRYPGITQTELAEMLEMERATAGRMLDRLERRGWLVRSADPADRRVNRLHLTAEADGIQAEMGRIATEFLDEAMSGLGEEERAVLTAMMERVKTQLQAMGPRGAREDAA